MNAETLGLNAFESFDEFLSSDFDLGIVCTPNDSHARYSIALMSAGKNVLCEKPVTMSLEELREVIRTAELTWRHFIGHQNRRWDADYLAACALIDTGSIGNVVTVESRMFGERGVCFGWRADPKHGGGMLYDWGPHLVDQIMHMFPGDRITSVYARLLSVLTPAVDDYFELELQLSGGARARIHVGTFALQPMPRWMILGDRGTVRLDKIGTTLGSAAKIKNGVRGFDSVFNIEGLGPSRTMAPLQKDMLETIGIPAIGDTSMAYWNNILCALSGEASDCVTHHDLQRQMAVVDAAFVSSRENRVVITDI